MSVFEHVPVTGNDEPVCWMGHKADTCKPHLHHVPSMSQATASAWFYAIVTGVFTTGEQALLTRVATAGMLPR
ncbi:MAG: hypothetical protein ACXVYY_01235 [Oryzihumus sp.]